MSSPTAAGAAGAVASPPAAGAEVVPPAEAASAAQPGAAAAAALPGTTTGVSPPSRAITPATVRAPLAALPTAASRPPIASRRAAGSGQRSSRPRLGRVSAAPVLRALNRLGADPFCLEVINNIRSGGRMLLANSAAFPVWRSAHLLLAKGDGSPSDPTQLFLLDCSDGGGSASERRFLANSVAQAWQAERSPSPLPSRGATGATYGHSNGAGAWSAGSPAGAPHATNLSRRSSRSVTRDGSTSLGGRGASPASAVATAATVAATQASAIAASAASASAAASAAAAQAGACGDDAAGASQDVAAAATAAADAADATDSALLDAFIADAEADASAVAAAGDPTAASPVQTAMFGAAVSVDPASDVDADVMANADADVSASAGITATADAAHGATDWVATAVKKNNSLDIIAASDSWAQSLSNQGPLTRSKDRAERIVTSAMVNRFLSATRLPRLSAFTFAMCIRLWQVAAALSDAITTKTGEETRDWQHICPAEVYDYNWALRWTDPMLEPVGDRTSMHPPKHCKQRSKISEKRIALVVSYTLSPFWTRAVNIFAGGEPDKTVDETGEANGELGGNAAAVADRITSAAGGVLPPRASGGPAALGVVGAPAPVASTPQPLADGGAAAIVGALPPRGRTPPPPPPTVSSDLAAVDGSVARPRVIYGTPPPSDLVAGVRRLRKLGDDAEASAAFPDGDASPEPPCKQPRLSKSGCEQNGALSVSFSLVSRSMLGQARTAAPSMDVGGAPEPSTPWQVNRAPRDAGTFQLRRAAADARRVTVSDLVKYWVTAPSLSSADATVGVRLATVREWREVVAAQDQTALLLDACLLAKAWQLLADSRSPQGDVIGATCAPDKVPRYVVDVTRGDNVQHVPHTALDDMQAVLTSNSDFKLAFQSKVWLAGFLRPDPPGVDLHDFLVPLFTSLPDMASVVRSVVGAVRPDDVVWARTVPVKVFDRAGAIVAQSLSSQLTARDVVVAARQAWLKCSFIDAVLVELNHYAREHRQPVHVMTCEQFTSLIRTHRGDTPTMSDATTTAQRLAKTMPSCNAFATMVNINNQHWCAAVVRLDEHTICMYDPKPDPALAVHVNLAWTRLQMLANTVAIAQAHHVGKQWLDGRLPWEERRAGNVQVDLHNCGAFSLQFLVHAVTNVHFQLVGCRGDDLRLVLVHILLHTGVASA